MLAHTRYRSARNVVRVGLSEADVIGGIRRLCEKKYGNSEPSNLKKMFESYDGNGDGCLNSNELNRLLKDANSCHWLGCGVVSAEIIKSLDKDANKCISWAEYAERVGAPLDPDGLTEGKKTPVVKPAPVGAKPKWSEFTKGGATAPVQAPDTKTVIGEAVSNAPQSTPKGSGGMVLLGAAGIGLIILAAR